MQHSPRFLALVQNVMPTVREITPEALQARQIQGTAPIVIDVREESEFTVDHLEQAIALGKGIVERDIEKVVPDPNTEVVLYCGGGFRSALAADALQKMGYTNVWSLAEGIKGWRSRGYKLVSIFK